MHFNILSSQEETKNSSLLLSLSHRMTIYLHDTNNLNIFLGNVNLVEAAK